MNTEAPRVDDLRMDVAALLGAVWGRWRRVAVVTLLLLAITFGVLLFMPKMYESSASILVEDRSSSYTRAAGEQASPSSALTLDVQMSSQIELIKSRDTLLAVVDSENLRSVSEFNGAGGNPLGALLRLIGRKAESGRVDEVVLQNLSERLTVIRERDSAVISIFVRSADPTLAARVANAIANEHVKRRAGLSLADTAEASVWLEQQIEALRVKVDEAESRVANYKVDNDIFVGSNESSLLGQQLSDIAGQITAAQERRNSAQQRAALIRGLLNAGQPVDGVPDVRESITIQHLTQSKATLQGELAQRSATLLPSHPAIKALAAQIKEIDEQISAEGSRIAAGLEAQVMIEAGIAESLNQDLARAKVSSSVQTRDKVTLDSLEREAKAQRDLLESYLLKYRDAASRSESSSALPDVRVVTLAAPAVTPVSPKTTLILSAVGLLSVALQVGAIIFGELLSGRAIFDRGAHGQVWGEEDDAPEAESQQEDAAAESPVQMRPQEVAPVAAGAAAVEHFTLVPTRVVAPSAPEQPASAKDGLALDNLSADIGLGRVRVVLLAALDDSRDAANVAEVLVADALRRGLTVVRLDAGSGRMSSGPGLTDLCADLASYGDVVQKVTEGLAEVQWGRQAALERRSMRPITLVEALTDIYEVVIVDTGRIGMASSLPVFAGAVGRLVLVGNGASDPGEMEAAAADAKALGLEIGQTVTAPRQRSEVA